MRSQHSETSSTPALDLSKWKGLPNLFLAVGGLGVVVGLAVNWSHLEVFGFAWLPAFMFFLSLGLGGLGLTILHHLFDAGWSVPIRRINEKLGSMLAYIALLWIPIGLLKDHLYEWIRKINEHAPDLSTKAKFPLFTIPGFFIVSIVCLVTWWFLSRQLLAWSVKQDETGSAHCTRMMRRYSAGGVFLFALTLTFAAIMWVKALEHEWFSTMYGVYYFAGSMWTTIATVYLIVRLLDLTGPLKGYVHEKTYYYLGTLLFAFTVFYAYVTFAQYFIIWNANVPEETFWYLQREKGTWFYVGAGAMIFGHFFVPFLSLLRIDAKLKIQLMFPLVVWAWIMHYVDMCFNIGPVAHPDNFTVGWLDIACWLFMAGLLSKVFIAKLYQGPMLPQKDPRFAESQDLSPTGITGSIHPGGALIMEPSNDLKKSLLTNAYLLASLGALLIVALLVYITYSYTKPAPVNQERAAYRAKTLAEMRAADHDVLYATSYAWQDQAKGMVRLPVDRSKELFLKLYANPAAGRKELIAREEKATAVPPPVSFE